MSKFDPGDGLEDLSARELNRHAAAADLIGNLTVGPGLFVERRAGGLFIGLSDPAQLANRFELTVAIVRRPAPEDTKLLIRPVRYRDLPPKPERPNCADGAEPTCRYAWADVAFPAWPDFGTRTADYLVHYWPESTPTLETPYLRARRDDVWIVELPAYTVRHIVIRSIPDPGANYVNVQDIRPELAEGDWSGAFEASGPIWAAAVHPYSLAGDYEGLVWPAEQPIEPATPILKAYRESGGWWVSQYVRFQIPGLSPDLVFDDCTGRLLASGAF